MSLAADDEVGLAPSEEKTAIQKILYPEPEELPENFEVRGTERMARQEMKGCMEL